MKTREELKKQVTNLIGAYEKYDKVTHNAIVAGCLDVNGPLYTAFSELVMRSLALVDDNGWIDWFIYENDLGLKGMKAGYVDELPSGELTPITDINGLVDLIIKYQNRE